MDCSLSRVSCSSYPDNLEISYSLFDIAIQICSPSFAPFLNGLGKVPTTLRAETWMVLLLCIVPRNKKPSSTVNFLRLARYYRSSSGVFSSAGQPCKTKCKTRERTASPLVASLILLAVMGGCTLDLIPVDLVSLHRPIICFF